MKNLSTLLEEYDRLSAESADSGEPLSGLTDVPAMLDDVVAALRASSKIEILHVRDVDGGCEHRVLMDGKAAIAGVTIEDVDPGRGHQLSEWDAITEAIREQEDYSPEFRAMVCAERDEARESKYVEDDS